MKKAELAAEFSSILRLLREHAFLRYSSAGRQEYEQRLLSASTMFSDLVSRATGLMLPSPLRYAELEKVSDGSYATLVRTVRRVVVKLRTAASAPPSRETRKLVHACKAWEQASEVLANLRD
jgi:hypothetical protein